jgi:hypothetical protein
MPISFPISLPTSPAPSGISFRPRSVVGVDASPFTLQAQSYAWRGQLLSATVRLPRMARASAEAWIAALMSLNGREGSFLLGDSANTAPRGTASGSWTAAATAANASDLNIATGTGGFLPGDWIQLGSSATARLYKVLSNDTSSLSIWPRLRTACVGGEVITYTSPKGRFMLAQEYEWDIDEAKLYGLSFDVVEDLRS